MEHAVGYPAGGVSPQCGAVVYTAGGMSPQCGAVDYTTGGQCGALGYTAGGICPQCGAVDLYFSVCRPPLFSTRSRSAHHQCVLAVLALPASSHSLAPSVGPRLSPPPCPPTPLQPLQVVLGPRCLSSYPHSYSNVCYSEGY